MKLVIVESPAKAKTINKYLGSDYKVLASFGHIRDLPSKNGSVEPDNDFAMHYEISSKSGPHVKAIADAAKQSDEILLATDPDREGEAISWHIVETLKSKRIIKKTTKVSRVIFHEITKKAVCHAVENPKDLDINQVNAQQARRALDYLVGFNISPILWRKLPGSRSAGRVQSVALRLICEREHEIELFNSQEYWNILLHVLNENQDPFSAKITHLNGKKLEQFDINNEHDAKAAQSILNSEQYHIQSIEAKQSKRNPYPPFTTSSLQQEASRKLGFRTKHTMMVAQKLYEGIAISGETMGLITYMRTDSVTISNDALNQTRKQIETLYGKNYLPETIRTFKNKSKNAQEAHEAIRPTDMMRKPADVKSCLDNDQYRLYKLIWDRTMACQMMPAILNQVAVTITDQNKKHEARANGSSIHFDGFYRIYREGTDDDSNDSDEKMLPPLKEGESLTLQDVEPTQHFTQPPPRYTEASLVKKLEELGIGRPSTYASIISVLQDRNYVILEKKRFVAEDRGRIVTAFLASYFKRYVEYDFTANLEEELDRISNGELNWKDVLTGFWKDFNQNVSDVEKYTITEVIHELNILLADYLFTKDEQGEPNRICPSCDDGQVSLKLGKFGAFLGCSNYPDCNYTKQLGHDGESSEDGGTPASNEPISLGNDPETSLPISLRQGPYGPYVQLGEASEDNKKPKRTSIPKHLSPNELTLEQATALLSLPREIGIHPDTSKPIMANIGRYGPYLQHDGKFTSLKEDDVLTIGINRAVIVISENKKSTGAEPVRVVGKHPESDLDIAIYDGRYGPYIKYDKRNISLPKSHTIESLTIEDAAELIANAPEKKSKKKSAKKKPIKKKAAPKKKKS